MKHFIKRLGFFSLFALLLLIGLDLFFSNSLRKNTFTVWNEISHTGIDADVLIIGSSRAREHYSPLILDSILNCNSYNLGSGACKFNRQWDRYQVYRLHNKKPNVIIQNIDFFSTLGYQVGVEREQFFPFFYDKEMMQIITEPFYWYEYLPFTRYIGYSSLLKNQFFHQDESTSLTYKGYEVYDFPWDGTELAKIDSLNFDCDEKVKTLFCHYLEQTKKENIQVIFVYAPFYIEGINKVRDLDKMYCTFDSIAKTYNIPILDYTYSEISYDTIYFRNASHLNKQGAELFSIMLANDLDSLGIIH